MRDDDELVYDDDEVMDEEEEESEEAAGPVPALPPLALGGATFLTAGAIDLMAHLGPTGLLVGGLAAIVAFRHGGDILDTAKTWLTPIPSSPHEERTRENEPDERPEPPHRSKRSLLDRALGRFPDEQEDEPDTFSSERPEPEMYNPRLHRDCLHLGCYLHPHADEVLSKRLALFGLPGSGKSNGVAVFVEELAILHGIGTPLVLGDTEGEYSHLCSPRYLLRPVLAHAGNLSPQNAVAFGQAILEHGYQVVLDLPSYESDDEAALVMIGLIAGMRAWAEARPNDERAACMFILDEAAYWLPQRENESSLSKERDAEGFTLLSRLQQAFFGTVVRRGRKRGIGFLFASQRPADLDKRAISCDWYMLFRQTLPNDLARYAELGIPKDVAQALGPGEAWVIDPSGNSDVFQFRRRHSPDSGQTPGLASLRQHARRWEAAGAGLPPMQPLPMKPREEPDAVAPVQPSRRVSLVDRGVQAYLDGATSCPKLAAALDISSWDARQLMPKVQAALRQRQAEEQNDEQS